MTIEEFDKRINVIADDYCTALSALAAKFQADIDALSKEAEAAKLPDHLLASSAAAALKKVESLSS